jgi:hypothetical protein
MKRLEELQKTSQGRDFLYKEGVFTDSREFLAALKPPACSLLTASSDFMPVYAGQQVYADIHWSVITKFVNLIQLGRYFELDPFFVWDDTDTCGADKYANRIYWPGNDTEQSFRFVYGRYDKIETRFTPFDRENASRAVYNLERFATGSLNDEEEKKQIKKNIEIVRQVIENESVKTVRDFNVALTGLMFKAAFGDGRPHMFLSEMIRFREIQDSVNDMLNALPECIRVHNETRDLMIGLDIDPILAPLSESYLPFWYSCPEIGIRSKLRRVCQDGDQWAAASCKCGAEHRFYLGSNALSVSALSETGRFSLDVSMPIHLNDLFSGSVGGRSSGLYVIILNRILKNVLGRQPAPVFVPENCGEPNPDFFGLFHSYIKGSCRNIVSQCSDNCESY